MDDLDAAFAHYSAEDYTVQDWNALTGYYGTAWKELSTAEEEELEGIFTRATENMEAVETREMRVNAIVAVWRSEHRDALDAMNNHAVDEATAERLYGLAQEALKGIDAAFVVEHSDLAETADQEQVAALANEAVDKTLRSLSQLADAAAWVGTLNGLSERPLSEVTSEWYGSYADACTGADTYLLHLSRTMMQALEERRDLAQQKQQALTQLHMAYQSYDLTRYTAENQAKLEKILNAGRLAIEAEIRRQTWSRPRSRRSRIWLRCPPSTEEVSRAAVPGEVSPAAARAAIPVAALVAQAAAQVAAVEPAV
ncbi:hypothetical protein I4200191B4_05270 [Pseudoflavonifractor gallinarum]|uniref:hypothetical protein n=1 Tax=Pseudoflavonifractor gallinarum TaxID=2779352 RepID=UPI0036F3D489